MILKLHFKIFESLLGGELDGGAQAGVDVGGRAIYIQCDGDAGDAAAAGSKETDFGNVRGQGLVAERVNKQGRALPYLESAQCDFIHIGNHLHLGQIGERDNHRTGIYIFANFGSGQNNRPIKRRGDGGIC